LGIYPHAALGAIALVVGPLQFRRSLWIHRRALHRRLGIVYVACAALRGWRSRRRSDRQAAWGSSTATSTMTACQFVRAATISPFLTMLPSLNLSALEPVRLECAPSAGLEPDSSHRLPRPAIVHTAELADSPVRA
jgi:hypothetical protein